MIKILNLKKKLVLMISIFSNKTKIKNNTNKIYNFYPYGQIVRNKIPEITNFFILHEGPLGVFSTSDGNTELVEIDYDDIQEKNHSQLMLDQVFI